MHLGNGIDAMRFEYSPNGLLHFICIAFYLYCVRIRTKRACGLGVYMLYLVEACGQVDDLLATNDDMASKIGANIIPDGIPTAMECDWGQGSTYNLLACIAYLGCGILLCFAPKPDPIFT